MHIWEFSFLPPPAKKQLQRQTQRGYIGRTSGCSHRGRKTGRAGRQIDRQAGLGVTCVDHWEKERAGRKEIALIAVSCFLQIATSKSRCGPKINRPSGPMFQFILGLFITMLAPKTISASALLPIPLCVCACCYTVHVCLTVQTLNYVQELCPDKHKLSTIMLPLSHLEVNMIIHAPFLQVNIGAISSIPFIFTFSTQHEIHTRTISSTLSLTYLPTKKSISAFNTSYVAKRLQSRTQLQEFKSKCI